MSKIVAIVNQKGGVGKTTTAVNLAASVAAKGKKVLLADIDPQGNATSGFGVSKTGNSTYDLLVNRMPAKEIMVKSEYKNVWVLPASMNLAGAEIELVDMQKRESRLKLALSQIDADFDYIFLDCPPSLGIITLNALTAADSILVPIQCEYYALEGLSQLMGTVKTVKQRFNSRIEIEGVLLTMYDGRLRLTSQVVEEVKKYFPKKVYTTVIPRNVRLSEAPSYGEPVRYYDKLSKGAIMYDQLATEFLRNNRK